MRPFRRHPDRPRPEPSRGPALQLGVGRAPGEPAVHRGEWRSLPPIQRMVTPADGTFGPGPFGPGPFETGLTTRQSPALLGRLGHFVAPDAPGGTFEAVTRPLGRRSFAPPPGAAMAPVREEPPPELPSVAEPVTSAPGRPLVTAPPPAPPFVQRTAEPPPVARPAAGTVDAMSGPAPFSPEATPGTAGTAVLPMAPTVSGTVTPPSGTTPPLTALPSTPTPPAPTTGVSTQPPATPPSPAPPAAGPGAEVVRTTTSFGPPPRRPGLGAPLPPGVSRLPSVQRESATGPGAPTAATGVGTSTSHAPTSSPEATTEPVPSGDAPGAPHLGDDPTTQDEEAPTEIAPLVGLRRLPTTMDYGPDTPDEPTRALPDLVSTVQRQAISFVTAPNPFRVAAGTESATEPSRSAPEQPLDPIAPLLAERVFVSSSPPVGVQRLGSGPMPAEQPPGPAPPSTPDRPNDHGLHL